MPTQVVPTTSSIDTFAPRSILVGGFPAFLCSGLLKRVWTQVTDLQLLEVWGEVLEWHPEKKKRQIQIQIFYWRNHMTWFWPKSHKNMYSSDSITTSSFLLALFLIFNSLQPNDVIRYQTSWLSLILVMACHILNAKPLPEPMQKYSTCPA